MSATREVRRSVVIETTPERAFEAVTKASELREWCSAEAWTEVRHGGRYDVRWISGYRTDGKFIELDPPHRAAVTWRGTGEPGETAVEFAVKPKAGGVEVTVVHRGFGTGAEWDEAVAASENGWTVGLENLKSTLETGVDLRIARRPFMGIFFDLLTAERAAKEGIAAEHGIYIENAVEGSGAKAAGLGKGDVIIAIGDVETLGFQELETALQALHVGDAVDVKLVRGQKQETVQVTLGQRPSPEVPDNAEELAETLARRYQETDAALLAAVEGLTDEEADRRPADGEWSVKEVLAHLSLVERDQQCSLASIALDGWVDTGPGNPVVIPGRLAAVLSVTRSLQRMVERFQADEAETVAFVGSLPIEMVANKARFRRVAQYMVGLPDHTSEHIEQIKATIAAVRGS
jgi:uncharacterized protein YndB with AHSA1/START domain